MTTQQYRSVIVGVGAVKNSQGKKGGGHQIGYTHAETYQRSTRMNLVAGIDINAANLDAFNQQFGLRGSYSDYRSALRELRPEVVSICTYVGLHHSILQACVEAGVKAVICEKPFLASPAQCIAVREMVRKHPIHIVVAHPRRYRQVMIRARELIASGAIGKPRLISAGLGEWDLNEMGAHWFDLSRYLLGDDSIQWVMGQARVRDFRGYGHAMEENAVAYLGFAGGARVVIEAGGDMVGESISVAGTEGILHIHAEEALTLENQHGRIHEVFLSTNQQRDADWARMWNEMFADVVAWLDGGPAPRVAFDQAIQTCEAVLAAYGSAAMGDRVDLPFAGPVAAIDEYPVEIIARRRGDQGT